MQLMRLGRVSDCSVATSTLEDIFDDEETFSSDGGEYGDDGRSDTTELPDPPAGGLPNSPIIYPRDKMKFKTLDEILPSVDTTEPSDNEESPEQRAPGLYYIDHEEPSRTEQLPHLPHSHGVEEEEDYDDLFDDDADETYIGKEEEEDDDADYDEDLDEIPLIKTVRGRKTSSAPSAPSSNMGVGVKIKPALPKGVVKATKRRQQPILQTNGTKKPRHFPEPHWPISPASPPSSRKPSVASSNGNSNKSRSNITTLTLSTPTSLYSQQTATPVDDRPHLLGPDEPLPKPRCQRCRKSKKGCDRQRPCQRCKDAGLGADECISEDEAGTRRGRQAAAAARKAAAGGSGGGLGKLKTKVKKKKVLGE